MNFPLIVGQRVSSLFGFFLFFFMKVFNGELVIGEVFRLQLKESIIQRCRPKVNEIVHNH